MTSPSETSRLREMVRLLLPKEHGSWSLALEPLVLGLVAAQSAAGDALGAAVLAGFLLRRPLKLLLGGVDPRRSPAFFCAVVLGAVALSCLLLAATLVASAQLWPLLLAVPPGAAFVWFESRGESRAAAAELAGAIAFSVIPAACATLAGWTPAAALALAVIMAGRFVPTVMTIRAYLRRNKGQAVSAGPALAASTAAVMVAMLLAHAGLAPWTATAVMVLLLARAWVLLGPLQPRVAASRVGVAESALGGVLVIVLALSWNR
jgi:hypothetical protein